MNEQTTVPTTETPEEIVADFSKLLDIRTSLASAQQKLEAKKDAALKETKDEIAKLQLHIEALARPFSEKEDVLDKEIALVTEQLKTEWKDNKKTQVRHGFIVRRRDLTSVDFKDKDKLIERLQTFGNLKDYIKKFDEKAIKTLAGAVDMKECVEIVTKLSVSCGIDKKRGVENGTKKTI